MIDPALTSPLRVGLIGFGYAGSTFHAPLVDATAGLELAAVASSNAAKVMSVLRRTVDVCSADDLIGRADIDLVVIATPNDSHHRLALSALHAGHHVVIDKPFTVSVAEAHSLLHLAQERRLVLSAFHNRRWDSDFIALRQVVAAGMVGRTIEFQSCFDRFRPEVLDRWRERDQPGAGLWMDLGPHLLDQALQLFGLPDSIALERKRVRACAKADDCFRATLRWQTGAGHVVTGVLGASMLALTARPRFFVCGTSGSWQVTGLDVQESQLREGIKPGSDEWGRDHRRGVHYQDEFSTGQSTPLPRGNYLEYYAAVRDAMRGMTARYVTAHDACAVQRLLEVGIESDTAGGELPLRW